MHREADRFAIGIVGDIHLEPAQMHLFDTARSQFCQALASASGCSRLVQLGDLGGYSHGPGNARNGLPRFLCQFRHAAVQHVLCSLVSMASSWTYSCW